MYALDTEARIDDLDNQRDCIKSSFLFSMADIFVGCCYEEDLRDRQSERERDI